MKKLVSLMMAACSILSAGIMLTSCGHTCEFATDWSKDATNHWHACTVEGCEEVADKAAHAWDAGQVTTPATSTTKGVKTYTCSTCAQTKTEEYEAVTTVTAAEWTAAFNLSDKTCKIAGGASAEMTMQGVTVSISMTTDFIVTETAVYGKNTQTQTMAGQTQEYINEFYTSKENDAYFEFKEEEREGAKVWVKTTITEDEYNDYKQEVNFTEMFPFAFENATYDATTKMYTVADFTDTESGQGYSNIKVQFADGKLESLSFTMTDVGMAIPYTISVVYDNISVTLPANAVDGDNA